MRVAIYTGTYVKEQDGVARATRRLAKSLLKQGHYVMVMTPSLTPQKHPRLSLCKLPSIPFILSPDYNISLPNGTVIRALKSFEPDIIHVTTPDFIGFQVVYFARLTHIPVVSIHHTDFPDYMTYFHMGFIKEFMWDLLVRYYNITDRTFAPTYEFKKILEHRGAKHVDVWSRGIDRVKFNPDFRSEQLRRKWGVENKKVIVYCGRFVWYKEIKIIAKVYKMFKDRLDKDVAFMLIGSGPAEDYLRKYMPKAIFPGYLHDKALSTAFASGDIFLFPSVTETFGQVIQEALSSGLPAIVSDVGGCKEIVQNSGAGIVMESKKTKKFFEAATFLIDNPVEYAKMRQLGIDYANIRTWDNINSKLIKKYKIIATSMRKYRVPDLETVFPMIKKNGTRVFL
jgi:glycosyltransferase involved in cell wall biosynthesis